jgi:hypothetical protein
MIRSEAICEWRTSEGLRKGAAPGVVVVCHDGPCSLTSEESRHGVAQCAAAEESNRAGGAVRGGVRPFRDPFADAVTSSSALDRGSSSGGMSA